ncbi:MAG: hypothetical protein GTO29_14215 [Candidatus Latescibacteria bacterium]|nr:hypothetical protein [Candidatus Latescibacterota bacterium]NIO57301.1 hypothetical protein [Candidatus Latescibacterota bacterium]
MPKHHIIIFIVGLLLFIPSLWADFMLDDFYYLGAIEGRFPEHNTDRSLFTFFINDEEATRVIARQGGYPWWIDERVRGETFRPLSDLLIRADHSFHGKTAFGYHLHSLAWWAATLLACGLIFRRALPGVIGTLAFLLFAVDEIHVMPVAWIANRNALVAVAPMLFGLWTWIRWCEDGWRAGRFLAPLGIVIGMAGSELGLAVLAYFIAYAFLSMPATGIRSRLVRLAPMVILGAAYAVVYLLLGYDSSGSGVYRDPLEDPAGFLGAVVTGIPTLLASGIAGFSADFWFAAPSLRSSQVVVGCVAILGLLGMLRSCWLQLDESIRRGLRWLLIGSALSLIPVAAVFPSDRMLLIPGIGLTAALATVLGQAYRSWRTRRRWLLIGVGGFLAIVHLVLAPILTIGIQTLLIKSSRQSLELAASPAVADAGGKETILIFAPDHVVSLYLPLMIDHLEGPAPRSWRPLSIAPHDHWLRRTGPRTLELEVAEGGVMLRSVFEELYRDPENQLAPGTVIDRGLLRAEILAANDRGPIRVAFHFDRDVSDPMLYFLVWQEAELRVADLPAVGEGVFLRRTLGPGGF